MKPMKFATVVLAAAMAVGTPAAAQEQYPSRMITVVVPLTAGTTIDILARLYAESLSKRFGQQVIVTNRPGAGGLIAAQAVAAAPADGYTVLLANSGHAILGTLNKNLPFDPIGDFAAVSLIGDAPTLVNVAPSLGVRTLTEFVDLAKAKPGTINYGSAGIGTATHLAGMYFASQTGTNWCMCPIRSARRSSPICSGDAFMLPSHRLPLRCRCCKTADCSRSPSRPMSLFVSRLRSRPRLRPTSITKTRRGTASWPRRKRPPRSCRPFTTRSPPWAPIPSSRKRLARRA